MSGPKLTTFLLSLSANLNYSAAVNHPFLISAGKGTLPDNRLALWLAQDRIYAAHAYPKFIASLITRIPFSLSEKSTSLGEREKQTLLKFLAGCLDNIVREVEFFNRTAAAFALDIDAWRERKGTRDYVAEMARVPNEGLAEGIIFLWAMEKVYLDAWSFVSSQMKVNAVQNDALKAFAANWTSAEFVAFVDNLTALVDGLGVIPGSPMWKKAEEIWARVIELEISFWPNENDADLKKLLNI